MLREDTEEFRRALEACERPGSGHLPEELRVRGVALTRRLVEEGECLAGICRALGISRPTAKLWSAAAPIKAGGSMAMVPVQVVAARATASTAMKAERRVAVVGPDGYRVDGLTLVEAAALMRALR